LDHVDAIKKKCIANRNVELETLNAEEPHLTLVKIKKSSNVDEKKRLKLFIVFGQHAREMIASETGYHFLNLLCDVD